MKWGGGEYRGWPTRWPVASMGALIVALGVGMAIFAYRNAEVWTPLAGGPPLIRPN